MIRKLAITAALATAALAGVAAPASAQSYGGITLSFGSGGYSGYDYDGDAYDRGSYYSYSAPWSGTNYYYNDPRSAWRNQERREQIERWQREQQQRRYWQHERQERQRWRNHDDDDD